MPNRVLRDWTASETVDQLSESAEILFVRLIMKADDLGCFYGNPKLLKSALFPLRNYSEKQVTTWRDEIVRSGIVQMYQVDGKFYLKIKDFNQRLRLMQSKFPQPEIGEIIAPSNDGQLTDNGRPETNRNEVEEETETETKADGGVSVWPSFEDFWDKYDKKQDRPKCLKKWEKIKQGAREKIMEHLELYVRSTPDIQFRKNPLTYLNSESWENEIIISNGTHQNGKQRITEQGSIDRLNSYT